jgi:hypothetical protein
MEVEAMRDGDRSFGGRQAAARSSRRSPFFQNCFCVV